MAGAQRVVERGRHFGLDCDNFKFAGVPGGDTADEASATNANKKRIELRSLLFELDTERGLAEQRFELIVSVDGHRAGLRDPSFAGGEGIGVQLAGDDEIGTGRADALDFFGRGRGGQENLCRNTEFACRVRDRYSVIAAGCGNDASRWYFAGKKICEGAASLEGAGVLEKFQFEDEADRIQAEIGRGDFEDRCAANVRPDESFNFDDAVALNTTGAV